MDESPVRFWVGSYHKMERRCYLCNSELTACFGYVIAGDFMDYMAWRRQEVRELCGKDVLRLDLISEMTGRSIRDVIQELL